MEVVAGIVEIGDADGVVELHVALPVNAASGGSDLDVEDDVSEYGIIEDLVDKRGPEESDLDCGDLVLVGEEDGEHVVAGRTRHDGDGTEYGRRKREGEESSRVENYTKNGPTR